MPGSFSVPLSYLLTPSFILLGASANYRYSGKLLHPSKLSRQTKTVIFISKITMTTVEGYVLAEGHIVVPIEN